MRCNKALSSFNTGFKSHDPTSSFSLFLLRASLIKCAPEALRRLAGGTSGCGLSMLVELS